MAFFPVGAESAQLLRFNSEIRPLLSDRCFPCHGFDAKARKANLRLDTAEGAFALGKNGPAIVPGDLERSLIWERINSDNPDEVMPPPDSHLSLSPSEKQRIREWILQGAQYEKHWAFLKVQKPTIPNHTGNAIDDLISQRLKQEELTLSPKASDRILIRRLSFDLRGLPPTQEELDTFLQDQSSDAWEKLVDRFLADPAFGERMSWAWLDAARYADSNGYQGDRERTMWPWRDWVIKSFNENLPFDQFTIWQIAGDLLPKPTHEQLLATGFLRNHPINGEGGRIAEENRVDYVMDMAETVATTWLGLTFNCARCHDHKYDPISQNNYYGLFDFFNHTPVSGAGGDPQTPPILTTHSAEEKTLILELREQLGQIIQKQSQFKESVQDRLFEWEKNKLREPAQQEWTPFLFTEKNSDHPELTFSPLSDHSLLTSGSTPKKVTYTLSAQVPQSGVRSLRIDALRHPSFTDGGLAPSDSGNFVLTSFEAYLHLEGQPRRELKLQNAQATFEQNGWPVEGALDKQDTTGWAVWNGKRFEQDHAATFELAEPIAPQSQGKIELVLRHQSQHQAHYLGRFRISHTLLHSPQLEQSASSLSSSLKTPKDQRTPDQQKTVFSSFVSEQPEFSDFEKLEQQRNSLVQKIAQIEKSAPKVMIMADQKKRRETYVLKVGSYQEPLGRVDAHTPEILPPLNQSHEKANRLDLARWLVSRENPLTARVIVNRVWQELFGIGFVKSAEDFGVQSEIPSHPQTLDWLAADFMEHGWNFKRLIRQIVTSQTYRQASEVTSLQLEKDPHNRLLARASRFRLASWMIRDQALASSGLLRKKIGGVPVKPWQPEGLWQEVTFGKKKYTPDQGENLYRRSLYTFWRRISAPPMFFDTASRETCEVTSHRTNSPLHALITLNDPLYSEAARALALRARATQPQEPIATAFESVLSRRPRHDEHEALRKLFEQAKANFSEKIDQANALLAIGESPSGPQSDTVEIAALTTVCLAILNTDEALTRE